jgi:type VI secretion system secreted protein VgrG
MRRGPSSRPIGSSWYQPPHLFLHGHLLGWPLDNDRLYRHLKRWEGVVGHMYLDTHKPPLVTVGAGNMVASVSAAQALPFVNARTGRRATKDEIAYAFQKVTAMSGARPASHYRLSPSIEIPEERIKELALERLRTEFIPGIKKLFRRFDDFPLPAREAIIDIAYNAGVGRAESHSHGRAHKATGLHGFHWLKLAIEDGDWMAAARSSHRSSARPERNRWTRDQFEHAAYLTAVRGPSEQQWHLVGGQLKPPFR